jgi:PAS domain S-box-containing protein
MAASSKRKMISRASLRKRFTRARIKSAARHDETKLRKLIDKMPAGIFVFESKRSRLVNPAAEALTGYSRKELLRMDFEQIVHPDFTELLKQRGPNCQQREKSLNTMS